LGFPLEGSYVKIWLKNKIGKAQRKSHEKGDMPLWTKNWNLFEEADEISDDKANSKEKTKEKKNRKRKLKTYDYKLTREKSCGRR